MLRIIGILTGSALAIAVLILTLGVPHTSESVSEPASSESVTEAAADTQVIDSIPENGQTFPYSEDTSEYSSPAPLEDDPQLDLDLADAAPDPVEERWYAFWSPFRSEIAANGFVSKLQEATGLDYRVVRVKTGVYEVAFAYTDDAEIQDKLARIASATGLDLSGG